MKENKEKRMTRKKSKFLCSSFSTVRRINKILEVYFTLEYLRVFIHKSFASLCSVYLGAVPIP